MKRKIFSIFFGLSLVFSFWTAFSVFAQDSENQFFLHGQVIPPSVWSGWHTEKVLFDNSDKQDSEIKRPYIDNDGILHGSFWLWTVGWVTFDYMIPDKTFTPRVNCPDGILIEEIKTSSQTVCPVSGRAWSYNAWWIIFDADTIWVRGQGVFYNPNSANIEWFAWSSALGWMPMFSGVNIDDKKKKPEDFSLPHEWYLQPETTFWANVNFIWKVAIIGNIAGTKVFDVINNYQYENQKLGYSYSTVRHSELINQVRANIAHLVRNIDFSQFRTNPYNRIIYNDSSDYCLSDLGNYASSCRWNPHVIRVSDADKNLTTIVTYGKDIIIDSDFNASLDNQNNSIPKQMKAIIALKDEKWNGGNIYITRRVWKIYAYVLAEGSVFSGEKNENNTPNIYAASVSPFAIPQKQLYINGIVISKNTIGWATNKPGNKCPILIKDCSDSNAHLFDMDYFRNYNSRDIYQSSLPNARRWLVQKIQNATVIIDYNNNIIYNPPIWLEHFQ